MRWPFQYGTPPAPADCYQRRALPEARTLVVCGMGGVGKTQAAAGLVHELRTAGELDLLVWLQASSRPDLLSAYQELAELLTGERAEASLLSWLATTDKRWLVVLDDLVRPADLVGLWPPLTGRTVVTTRRRESSLRGTGREVVELSLFTAEEAAGYLESKLGQRCDELAQALGHLPLALAQAAAVILDRGTTPQEYLARFRRRRLQASLPDPDGLPDEYLRTVATTYALSIELANALPPEGLAGPLLDVASVLADSGIRVELFQAPSVLQVLSLLRGRPVTAEDVLDGLSCLRRVSLCALDDQVHVHGLVQRAVREALPEGSLQPVVMTAVCGLAATWPRGVPVQVERQSFIASVEALYAHAGPDNWVTVLRLVVRRAAMLLYEAADFELAGLYYRRLEEGDRRWGAADPAELISSRLHATLAGLSRGAAAVRDELEVLAAEAEAVLGPHHQLSMTIRISRAENQSRTSGDAHVLRCLEELRAEAEQHCPEALHLIRQQLAVRRRMAGDLARAQRDYEELLAEQLVDPRSDDRLSLLLRLEIADLRARHAGPAAAAAEHAELYRTAGRLVGPEAILTMAAWGRYAFWREASGAHAEVLAGVAELAHGLRAEEDPTAPRPVSGLALGFRAASLGRLGPAGELYEGVRADALARLGPDDPVTRAARALADSVQLPQ